VVEWDLASGMNRDRRHIYVSWNACSVKIYHGSQLARLQRGYIYAGPHAYSAHYIPGPIHYMWLQHISWLRLAGMLKVR